MRIMDNGYVQVEIATITEKLTKNVKFLQPLYEAILNSLEAEADNIEVTFQYSSDLVDDKHKIIGFTIIDNGIGFTPKTIDAFCQLWTKNKLKLGCKGSGRFTWLSVFENINIESYLKDRQEKILIPFSTKFNKNNDIKIEMADVRDQKTLITFSNITEQFYKAPNETEKGIDKRFVADVKLIKRAILEYLLIRLFLLKKKEIAFNITLKLGDETETINYQDIPDLKYKDFAIYSNTTNQNYDFRLYYRFIKDAKNSKKVFYCANNRATKEMDDDALGFSCALPNKDSFIMLLCSDYFDDKDNDSRDDLPSLSGHRNPSIDIPLLYSNINPEVKKIMQEIIKENYPEIAGINAQEENDAINEKPYLAAFLKADNDAVKDKKSLISKATKAFNEAKDKAQEKFESLLTQKNVSTEEFTAAISALSFVAAAELGEYILYRDRIIKALESAIPDVTKKENFIHNIFMPMRTTTSSADQEKHLLSNLWLLDDKFMTYSYAASDTTIEAIKEDIAIKNSEKFKDQNRPDLAIFFNTCDGSKNLVVIEFKGANADKFEKKKALTELPDDVAIIKRHIPNIITIWSYIITSIDDEFKESIENQEMYIPLYTNESTNRVYYKYFSKQNAHEFILDLNTITSDALDRNSVFMEILKKQ